MEIIYNHKSVVEYCAQLKENKIKVNPDYQRSDKIWPDQAKSFFIESILLEYPIPKLSLVQITDTRSKSTYSEIVDGQQRSKAILEFFENELRLSKNLGSSYGGLKFQELEEPAKQSFLEYSLAIDVFVGTQREDVIEVFRRMNSYNVPLNPEEHRHAVYQGEFKWFVTKLIRQLSRLFLDFGIFNEKQVVRMSDAKLVTEVCHAFENGITTTSKKSLDDLYKRHNKKFPKEKEWGKFIVEAINEITQWDQLHQSVLMKPYNVYSLALAITHVRHKIPALNSDFKIKKKRARFSSGIQQRLSELAEAVVNDDIHGEYSGFVEACRDRTNVAEQRRTRFRFFCKALMA